MSDSKNKTGAGLDCFAAENLKLYNPRKRFQDRADEVADTAMVGAIAVNLVFRSRICVDGIVLAAQALSRRVWDQM